MLSDIIAHFVNFCLSGYLEDERQKVKEMQAGMTFTIGNLEQHCSQTRPRGYKTIFMLNSAELIIINLKYLTVANSFLLNIAKHENFSAKKYENVN